MFMRRFVCLLFLFGFNHVWADDNATPASESQDALNVFEQRIMPIFRSPKPSSCIQCHLASVDLRDYILPSHERTFFSLLEQGLIDRESPTDSKILNLIRMGNNDPDPMSKRIHAKTRRAELEAFTAWIEACCSDPDLMSERIERRSEVAKPTVPDEVIRHARKDRVLDSFIRNVWSQRMRCFPCHTPHEIDANNPMHKKPQERQREMVAKHGARMNIFQETPLQTMRSMLAGRHVATETSLPMLNFESPAESLLLLKPTAKLPAKRNDGTFQPPSSLLPVSHMGGLKMHVDDMSYKAVLGWIEDVANLQRGVYSTGDELPADNWIPTQKVIRVKEIPENWPRLGLVQVFVYPATQDRNEPLGFTQAIITPRGIINGSLMLFGSKNKSEQLESGALEPGDYRIELYLDRDQLLKRSPGAMLNARSADAELTFAAKWRDGFKNAEVVSWSDLSVFAAD